MLQPLGKQVPLTPCTPFKKSDLLKPCIFWIARDLRAPGFQGLRIKSRTHTGEICHPFTVSGRSRRIRLDLSLPAWPPSKAPTLATLSLLTLPECTRGGLRPESIALLRGRRRQGLECVATSGSRRSCPGCETPSTCTWILTVSTSLACTLAAHTLPADDNGSRRGEDRHPRATWRPLTCGSGSSVPFQVQHVYHGASQSRREFGTHNPVKGAVPSVWRTVFAFDQSSSRYWELGRPKWSWSPWSPGVPPELSPVVRPKSNK